MLASVTDDASSWMRAGRSLERIALFLTSAGLQHAYANGPCEGPTFRGRLAELAGLTIERPQALRRRHGELYETLRDYFAQDPAAWEDVIGRRA